MAAPRRRWAAELLYFWFHCLTPRQRFGSDADEELRKRFASELQALCKRPATEFLDDPQVALAGVILFDQIPRNIHRGTARAFAFDPLARAICRAALLRGWDRGLSMEQRQFLAMPLMHSERIADQLWSLRYFTRLGLAYGADYARSHHAMIARFGRYPHRNTVLGRASTEAEKRAVASGFAW